MLILSVDSPVKFITPLKDVEFNENEDAKLECEVNKVVWNSTGEPITFIWHKGAVSEADGTQTNEKIAHGGRFNLTKLNKRLIIKIQDLALNDAGCYSIVADKANSTCFLNVNEIPVTIKRHLSDARQKEGQSCAFECIVNRPDKEFKWFINDCLITKDNLASGKYTIRQEKCKLQLVINNLELSDNDSVIKCVIGDRAKSEAKIAVDEEDIKFLDRLVDVGVKENDDAKFTCKLSKLKLKQFLEPVNFTWFIKGKELNDEFLNGDNRFRIEQNETIFNLYIKSVKPEDHGEVKFQVRNDLYNVASLVVEEEPIVFLKKLEDVICTNIPDTAYYECELSKLNVNVNWLKDGQQLRMDLGDKYEFGKEGTKHFLMVKKVDGNDEGNYTISIPGKVEKKCVASLSVKSGPKILEESKNLNTITVKRGQPLLLEIKFTANPKPKISWLFDEESIAESSRVKKETVRDKLTTFILDKTTRKDTGVYTIIIENEYGRDTHSIKANILDKPGTPRDLKATDILGNDKLDLLLYFYMMLTNICI